MDFNDPDPPWEEPPNVFVATKAGGRALSQFASRRGPWSKVLPGCLETYPNEGLFHPITYEPVQGISGVRYLLTVGEGNSPWGSVNKDALVLKSSRDPDITQFKLFEQCKYVHLPTNATDAPVADRVLHQLGDVAFPEGYSIVDVYDDSQIDMGPRESSFHDWVQNQLYDDILKGDPLALQKMERDQRHVEFKLPKLVVRSDMDPTLPIDFKLAKYTSEDLPWKAFSVYAAKQLRFCRDNFYIAYEPSRLKLSHNITVLDYEKKQDSDALVIVPHCVGY